MIYIFIGFLLILTEVAYLRIADHFNIIDEPNARSSHTYISIRGGGIIFPFAVVFTVLFFDFNPIWAITGFLLITFISFLDDLFAISRKIRLLVHFISVLFLFHQFYYFDSPWYYWTPAFFVFIGWINAFNFMDGINGITPFYSLVCLGSFLFLSLDINFFSIELLITLTISVFIFTFFNARKRAKAFAGDVGSVSLAFLFGWVMCSLILFTQRFEYILFFSVYAADSLFTIMHRLIRHENIFEAHRSHLYQYFSNELGFPHINVAAVYAAIQLLINMIVVFLINNDLMSLISFIGFCIIISGVYLLIRFYVLNRIKFQ